MLQGKVILLIGIVFSFSCYSLSPAIAKTKTNDSEKIQQLKKQLEKRPEDKKLKFQLGRAYLKEKNYHDAILLLNSALDEKNPKTHLLLARAYRIQKKYLDEIRVLNLMIPKHPNYPKAYVLLANALIHVDRLDDAVVKYRQAIEISPKYEAAYWGLYNVYEKKKNNYESRIILLDLVNSFGVKSKYLNPLCRLYSIDSFFEDSINYCQKAVSKDPKHPENHIYLALTYKYAKNPLQAEKIIKSAAKQFPKSEFTQQTAGEIMQESENWSLASKYYSRCRKINKKNLACQLGLAKTSFNIGKYQLSNEAYLEACKIDRKTITEYKKSAAILRINKKTKWFNQFTNSIGKCY